MGGMRLEELDAVTLDAHGTLLELRDPVPALTRALAAHGITRRHDEVESAFRAEVEFYVPRSLEGRDDTSLADLRVRSVHVFLAALDASLEPAPFVPAFIGALAFRAIPGALETVGELTRRGLSLAVVANWDCSLAAHLDEAGYEGCFAHVVTSAESGAAKPDGRIFSLALERLAVPPGRAVHVGDGADDEEGAAAAGMRFLRTPLSEAFLP